MISGIFCIPTAWHVLIMTFMNAKVNYIVILLLVDFKHSKHILLSLTTYIKIPQPPQKAQKHLWSYAILCIIKTKQLNSRPWLNTKCIRSVSGRLWVRCSAQIARGATHYHAQLGLPYKGLIFPMTGIQKLLYSLTLACYQPSPEV